MTPGAKVVPIRVVYRPRLVEVVPFPVGKLDAPAVVWVGRLRPVYRFLEHPLDTAAMAVSTMSRETKFALWTLAGLVLAMAVSL